MRLAVDMSRAAGRRTGVGRYLEYLVREWASGPLPFEQVVLFTPLATIDPPSGDRFEVRVLPARSGGIRWQIGALRRAAAKCDVLFAPYAIPPGFRRATVVANLGIYEGPTAIPGLRAKAQSRHFAYSARHCDAVIANSASTKRDLSTHYCVASAKIDVVWPGVDARFTPTAAPGTEENDTVERLLGDATTPFLLFVGKLSLRRNVPALLQAFALLSRAHPELRLLLVGPDTSGAAVDTHAARLGLSESVVHVEHIEQRELAILYRRAAVFVLPTVAEGFSFTILEALASGTPVVTLEHDALAEAELTRAVIALPDPEPKMLAAAIDEILVDHSLAARLRGAGPTEAKRFSWTENARRTMEICAAVAVGSR